MKTRSWFCIFCLCLTCLTGCTGTKTPDVQGGSESDTMPLEADWKTKGFPVQEGMEMESVLWAAEYTAWEHGDIDYDPYSEFLYERQAWV